MAKTIGAITKNKNISWRVQMRTADGIQEANYPNLKLLCSDLNIHRTNVYKIRNGFTKPIRKRHIISIDKINDSIEA
jgi:hypothetical protein